MHATRTKAELLQHKAKLANSYAELLDQFSSKDLRHVGNYTLGKLIGKGSFGKVYLAKHDLTNGSKVVLKASNKDDSNLAREIHHHRQFVHPHIARLYEVVITEDQVWLALEYCPGDELYHYLSSKGALPVETTQKIFAQLVGAVAYIHSKACVHRDLKLENVLLDKNENVKLCDFGFTREYEGKTSYLQTFCGTICYSAPEMLRGEKYAGEKVDVWSLGIILYALLRGELPWDEDDDTATKAKIFQDDPVYPPTFPEAAKTLISKLLSKRPLHRPSLAEILSDPFLIDHAPAQQAILKLTQPAPFATNLEKQTLERMKAAGVDIDKVIENVLAQRCDALAGWWALLIEKETRKEARRERKRKEREADLKILRRLSGASHRLSSIPPLEQVSEEAVPSIHERPRSSSRGRTQRRSTPQILVSDLPQLPEGTTLESPDTLTPPPPIDKDSIRSRSRSRPALPPKERKRRSSTLQLVTTNPDLLGPVNGVNKRRGKRKDNQIFKQLVHFKSWIIETTKRAKSPGKTNSSTSNKSPNSTTSRPITGHATPTTPSPDIPRPQHDRQTSGTSITTRRSSYGHTLTPVASSRSTSALNGIHKLDTNKIRAPNHHNRNSLSPSPITPRSSVYRHHSGLRGRKSTSSSVSSIRSMHRRATHSKASSQSSNSMDTIQSPSSRSVGRSPHTSVKVLPATTSAAAGKGFRSDGRMHTVPSAATSVSNGGKWEEAAIAMGKEGVGGVMFAKRKKNVFKGPMLNSSLFGSSGSSNGGGGSLGSPAIGAGLRGLARRARGEGGGEVGSRGERKSQIIEEEEEEEGNEKAILEEEEEDGEVEEVDEFSDVEVGLSRGERVSSVVFWDEDEEGLRKALAAA